MNGFSCVMLREGEIQGTDFPQNLND